jgi:hypothetical protein
MRRHILLLIPLALSSRLAAQEVPPYVPLNPALASRSALYAQPFIPRDAAWRVRIVTDYSNAVEVSTAPDGRDYVFDAELLQSDLWVTRDLSPTTFVLGNVALRSGHAGFLDGFLNWYHDLIGLRVPARNQRTENRFDWEFELRDSTVRAPAAFIGDLRLGAGVRAGDRIQMIATVTLPTATTDADGWSRETVGSALAAVARVIARDRVALDVSATVGWTPTRGRLADYQRTMFVGGMASGWWRFAGQQAVFATVWMQSPNWKRTGFG